MARPGRPKKNAPAVDSAVTTTPDEASKEAAKTDSAVADIALGYVGDAELDPDRAAIYEEYEKTQNTESAPAEAVKAEEAKEPVKEEVPKEPAAPSPVVEATETKKEDYVPVQTEDEKKKTEIKTVPYDALHEEREKRKLAQAKNRELEDRLKALEEKVTSTKQSEPAENEYLTDEEKRLARLEKDNAELKEKERLREQEAYKTKEQMLYEKLAREVADTDKVLAAEGLPGFQFLQGRVGDELRKMIAEDPENIVLDSPEGWKRIYREKVFPTVKGLFVQADKQKLMEEKKAAKADAGLIGSPGVADKKPEEKKDDSWTHEEYLKWRRENSLV